MKSIFITSATQKVVKDELAFQPLGGGLYAVPIDSPVLGRGVVEYGLLQKSIDFKEILLGGPPKDGISSIDPPEFVPVAEVCDLDDTEPVIGVIINGDARTYPFLFRGMFPDGANPIIRVVVVDGET